MIDEGGTPDPPQPARRRSGAAFLVVLTVVGATAGIALLIIGVQAFNDADDTRERAADLQRHRRVLIARTDAAERVTDAPIGGAERVANSVASVVEATDAVIVESAATNQLLSQAVRLANSGDRTAANRIYEGEAAASVQRLGDALARAEAALAAAQQASADLDAATR